MEVILLQDVHNVGRKGEVKTVSDGFAMNSLLPRRLAEPATEAKVAALKRAQADEAAAHRAREEKLAADIKALNGARIGLTARATDKGGLFKSIGAAEIARAVRDQKELAIPEETIQLEKPFKTAGEHQVRLVSGAVSAELTVSITPQA